MSFTTTDLLTDIKLRAFIPTSQETFSNTDLLLIADGKTKTVLVPFMQSLRAEFFVWPKDHTIVANQANYEIPSRSIGVCLRDVVIVNSTGAIKSLTLMDREDIRTTSTATTPTAFYLQGSEVIIYKTPSGAVGTLRIPYYLRPGKLIETTSAAQITAIDTGTGEITAGSVPTDWSTSTPIDIVRRDSGEPLAIDLTPTAVTATTVTLSTSDLPSRLAVGDWLALAGETPIPQLPDELRPVLAQAAAVGVNEAMNLPGLDSTRKTLDEMMKAMSLLLTPRVPGAQKKVVQRNGWL